MSTSSSALYSAYTEPASTTAVVAALLAELGITEALLAGRALRRYEEATALSLADTGADGRVWHLLPAAAQAWQRMKLQAADEGVTLVLASAYRSIERQAEIIRAKLAGGSSIEAILRVLAPPGYSEHHTGRAVDIATPGSQSLQLVFAETPAYAWLSRRAADFGFSLSFPVDNPAGFQYEPWHWCWHPAGA